VSYDQACHRATTLRREGAQSFFLQIDKGGNATKRFSATAFHLAEHGGPCPRIDLHVSFRTRACQAVLQSRPFDLLRRGATRYGARGTPPIAGVTRVDHAAGCRATNQGLATDFPFRAEWNGLAKWVALGRELSRADREGRRG
jgi:hypothetical protein